MTRNQQIPLKTGGTMLVTILYVAIPLVMLLSFVLVVVKMFQHDKALWGIASLLGVIFLGVGPLIAFVMGWVKSSAWEIRGLMLIWTVAIIGFLILNVVAPGDWMTDMQQLLQ